MNKPRKALVDSTDLGAQRELEARPRDRRKEARDVREVRRSGNQTGQAPAERAAFVIQTAGVSAHSSIIRTAISGVSTESSIIHTAVSGVSTESCIIHTAISGISAARVSAKSGITGISAAGITVHTA